MSIQELEIAIEELSPHEVEDLATWLGHYRHRIAAQNAGAFGALRDMAGKLEMPPDWAAQHDHYLTGAPKREAEETS